MVSVCQRRGDVLKVDLSPPYAPSHGICKYCQPIYLRENGVPEKDIQELMAKEAKPC